MSLRDSIDEVVREYDDYSLDDLLDMVDECSRKLSNLRSEEDKVVGKLIELQAVIVVRSLNVV